jgi:hypothetical protein
MAFSRCAPQSKPAQDQILMFDADDLRTLKMGDFGSGMACILPPNATLSSDHMDKKDIGTVEYDDPLHSLRMPRARAA